jgi:DNA-directed RNA polymerase subunit N (RpoN/RPB10)
MSIPVRCTCGSIIGRKEMKYDILLESGKTPAEALNTLKVLKYCCRTHFLGRVDLYDQLTHFSNGTEKALDIKSDSENKSKKFLKNVDS